MGVTGQDCDEVHVVAEGDFCASIAAAADIELSTLLANNPNVDADCTNIGIGEVRVLSDFNSGPPPLTRHCVGFVHC